MSGIARDAIKFVRAFGGAIMTSTPHLYISALPFSPVQSIIYTQFSSKYSNLAQIVDEGEPYWPDLQLTIRGHPMSSVAFSLDGKRMASGCLDGTIYLWDAETGLQLGSPLTGHTEIVTSVAFSPDGKRIASGSWDNTICLWDAETGLQLGSPLTGHTEWVTSVAFSPDGKRIASGSNDKTICLWDAETGLQLGSPLIGHTLHQQIPYFGAVLTATTIIVQYLTAHYSIHCGRVPALCEYITSTGPQLSQLCSSAADTQASQCTTVSTVVAVTQ